MEFRVLHLSLIIELDRDFRVAFDAGHRIDDNFFKHVLLSSEAGFAREVRRLSGQ